MKVHDYEFICILVLYCEYLFTYHSMIFTEHTNVRLVNGSAPFQGRVEILHNSQWGSIYSTNVQGAKTICRMLRYNER